MHDIDLFRQGVQHHMPLADVDFQGSTAFAAWLVDDGIELFKKAFRQETGRAVSSLPEDKLIEQAYPKGMNEIETKGGSRCSTLRTRRSLQTHACGLQRPW